MTKEIMRHAHYLKKEAVPKNLKTKIPENFIPPVTSSIQAKITLESRTT